MPYSAQGYAFGGCTSAGEFYLLLALLPSFDNVQWRATTGSILRDTGKRSNKGLWLNLKPACCGYMECAFLCREPRTRMPERI